MHLPQKKEREYRFSLALRMGLPIFALMFALIFHTVITNYENLTTIFYIEYLIVLILGIYFIFHLIYSGNETKITDDVSKVFTRKYLYKYLSNELKKNNEYTLILISIDNLNDINNRYGIITGDKVLYEVGEWIAKELRKSKIVNFPMGQVKGGDFIVGLKGDSGNYKAILELMFLKTDEFKIDDIEVKIQGAINDTSFSNNLEYMVENLFEIKEFNKHKKQDVKYNEQEIKPNELENYVIDAIRRKKFTLMKQDVYTNDKVLMNECFVKLKRPDGKYIHQKAYIKIINKLRLMNQYDYMVLEKSIEICKKQNTTMVLSISPTSIRNHEFLSKVKKLMTLNPDIKDKIMFMLSEKEYFSYTEKYSQTIKILRNLGIKIALDKFGSYHCSFLYFKDFKVDVIRIDSSFTKDIANETYKSIIEGFCTMAKNSDTKIWMKMIENKQTVDKIQDLDIDYIQGKYLSDLEVVYEGQ
jgi:diguanylate cyclase (GGDEF)-like protein